MSPHSREPHYSQTYYEDPATAQAFDESRYGGEIGRLVAAAQEDVLVGFLGDLHGLTVLDIGTGTGRAALIAARLGAQVTALDRSLEMLRVGRARIAAAGSPSSFVLGDAASLMFPDLAFDAVISLRVLMHTPDWAAALAEMCRLARRTVVFDYPPLAAAPAFQAVLRRLRRAAGYRVETYRVISRPRVNSLMASHGFRVMREHRQFVLPIALHRAINARSLTERLEATFAHVGLTDKLGAPATVLASRIPS